MKRIDRLSIDKDALMWEISSLHDIDRCKINHIECGEMPAPTIKKESGGVVVRLWPAYEHQQYTLVSEYSLRFIYIIELWRNGHVIYGPLSSNIINFNTEIEVTHSCHYVNVYVIICYIVILSQQCIKKDYESTIYKVGPHKFGGKNEHGIFLLELSGFLWYYHDIILNSLRPSDAYMCR